MLTHGGWRFVLIPKWSSYSQKLGNAACNLDVCRHLRTMDLVLTKSSRYCLFQMFLDQMSATSNQERYTIGFLLYEIRGSIFEHGSRRIFASVKWSFRSSGTCVANCVIVNFACPRLSSVHTGKFTSAPYKSWTHCITVLAYLLCELTFYNIHPAQLRILRPLTMIFG